MTPLHNATQAPLTPFERPSAVDGAAGAGGGCSGMEYGISAAPTGRRQTRAGARSNGGGVMVFDDYGQRAATDFPSPSEMEFRQRVRDLEAAAFQHAAATARIEAENTRLRCAVRQLARLQPERVSRAVLEVLNDV